MRSSFNCAVVALRLSSLMCDFAGLALRATLDATSVSNLHRWGIRSHVCSLHGNGKKEEGTKRKGSNLNLLSSRCDLKRHSNLEVRIAESEEHKSEVKRNYTRWRCLLEFWMSCVGPCLAVRIALVRGRKIRLIGLLVRQR